MPEFLPPDMVAADAERARLVFPDAEALIEAFVAENGPFDEFCFAKMPTIDCFVLYGFRRADQIIHFVAARNFFERPMN